jgi:hypothetical protein
MSDLEFLQDTKQWPQDRLFGSYCCLKREQEPKHGYVFEDNPTYVYLGHFYDYDPEGELEYNTIQEMLDDGWRVD